MNLVQGGWNMPKKYLLITIIAVLALVLVTIPILNLFLPEIRETVLPNGYKCIRFNSQSDLFLIEFDVTVNSLEKEMAVGISSLNSENPENIPVAVKIDKNGIITAWNGSGKFSLQTYRIKENDTFHLRMVVNVAEKKYSAYVKLPGYTERLLGENMDFSEESQDIPSLDSIILASDTEALKIDNLILPSEKKTAIKTVWAVNDGERIRKDDLNNPNKESNSAWDGKKVKLFGGRNEIIAFQLIVEAGGKGINELSVEFPGLTHKNGKSAIKYAPPEKDPTLYVGRPISIFSQNYMFVSSSSSASWISPRSGDAASRDAIGWKPVQLVPENAKQGKGGFPLNVAPYENQGIWIEIYTARDLAPGIYEGEITVYADDEKRIIPVELELFDFTLPDENSMHAMLYYESTQPLMYHGRNMDAAYHRFAHRNRCEFVHGYDIASAVANLGRFTGSDFTKENGYEGPGENVGNVIIPRTFYSPGNMFDERENAWRYADAWMEFLKDNDFTDKITFVYMPDEPSEDQYEYIRTLARNIHSNPGPGKELKVFVTKAYDFRLDGGENSIDIWCTPTSDYDSMQAEKERSHGDDMWVYNGNRPYAGALIYETPGTDARANIWGCFKKDIKVYFYWHSVHWYHNHQAIETRDKRQNVWKDPVTYYNKGKSYANGDGVLVYPGEEKLHPEEDRGIEGPCSSIQMANIRRGMQDHLYLTMARNLGMDELVEEVLNEVVPGIFDPSPTGQLGFAQDGNIFENARYKLAKALDGKA